MSKLKITQKRSEVGKSERQRLVLKGLGLRGVHTSVVIDNAPAMRGMVKKVLHLVTVEEANG